MLISVLYFKAINIFLGKEKKEEKEVGRVILYPAGYF